MDRRVKQVSHGVYMSLESCYLSVEFRYVPECLPDVPLPKRVSSWSRPAFTRPRRLTSNGIMWRHCGVYYCLPSPEPSLLLEPKRSLLTSDLLPDLRNTLVANRMAMDSHREIGVVGRTGVRERGEAKVLSSAMYSEGAYTHSLSYSWKISGEKTNQYCHTCSYLSLSPSLPFSLPPSLSPSLPPYLSHSPTTALSCTSVASVPQSITSAASVLQVKDDHVTMPSIAQRGPPSAAPPTAHHSLCGRTPHTSENLTHTHASGSHWACDSWSGSAASSETTSTKNISSFTTSPHPTSTTGLFERRPTFSVQATPLPSTSFPPLHPPPSLPLQRADHVQPINPFYAKMPQHQPDESFNPFILALEKEAVMKAEQAAVKERTCHSDPFSFSLAHITRYM